MEGPQAGADPDRGFPAGEAKDDEEALRHAATQEIRLAVVLNGGVSLAVWISGVTLELHRLAQAGRERGEHTPRTGAYGGLLDLLDADARIDVIAGTSAGGINGGFLALGVVHDCDLSGLRNLWLDQGDLGILLRNPRQKDQPSLLRGEYFHEALAKSYDEVWATREESGGQASQPVDLYLTGTLWEGRRTAFADDMGRRIEEVDYDATFHFTSDPEVVDTGPGSTTRGDLRTRAVTRELAVASRCTASFPGAFEPFPVKLDTAVQQQTDGRWATDAGRANFTRSQFVLDGGVLRNKPIRPAIDAVYRQAADQQVRRILAYVVPDPGEPATTPGEPPPPALGLPGAGDVVLGAMTRLRSTDSVAEELAEIERRNQDTAHRRRTRDRLAVTLSALAGTTSAAAPLATDLVALAFPAYLEVRRQDTAQSVSRLLLSAPGDTRWSRREIATVLQDLAEEPEKTEFPFIPQSDLPAALSAQDRDWRWGQATVRRLGDVVLDVFKRAVWTADLADSNRVTIVAQRARAHEILREVRAERARLDGFWRAAGQSALPARSDSLAASSAEIEELRTVLAGLVRDWGAGPDPRTTARLKKQALDLAECLLQAKDALRSIAAAGHPRVDPKGTEQGRLDALVDALLTDASSPDRVLEKMLRLEVVHVAFAGVTDTAEQGVELVQVSCGNAELLTGIQLHHFGAFYRRSWRANDWLRGRLDGCEQLVQMLLAPERLRQLNLEPADALKALKHIAVGPDGNDRHQELTAEWDAVEPQLRAELQVLEGDEPLPRTFPMASARIAHRLRTEMLTEELKALALAVREEPDPVDDAVRWAAGVANDLDARGTTPTAAELATMLHGSAVVGSQRITTEGDRGSDTFARTVTHAAATLSSTAGAIRKPKAAVTLLKGLRGYAVLLWVLVNFLAGKSHVGRNMTSLIVGVGGAMIGLALVVPGVPLGVPLTGVVLVLAAASASALRQPKLAGWRLVGRLLLLTLLAAAVLYAVLLATASERDQSLQEVLQDIGLRALVILVVVGLGWILGRPSLRTPKRFHRT
jgi:patatin-related protein